MRQATHQQTTVLVDITITTKLVQAAEHDISCLLVSSIPPLFYTMSSHRDMYIYELYEMITQSRRGDETKAD
jgi:hypothetical protein